MLTCYWTTTSRKMNTGNMALVFPLLLGLLVIKAMADEEFTEHSSRVKRDVTPINKKLRIVTISTEPYCTVTQGTNGQEFVGFIPDLVFRLSQKLHFSYEFYNSPDAKYGSRHRLDGTWNGMIGEVIKNKHEPDGSPSSDIDPNDPGADMSAAPLTVTSARHEVVTFLHPFHNLGIIMVAQKPKITVNDTDLSPFDFSILAPLSSGAWGILIMTTLVVSLLLFAINHFNPYEWSGRYDIGLASANQRDAFNLPGSLWFIFTSLQWQGFERAPRSIAGKILTVFWFGFVTMTLVTYIGSMVNNLWWASMASRQDPTKHPILDLEDLVIGSGGNFKYGCVANGSTQRFVNDSARFRAEFKAIRDYWETEDGRKQLVLSTAAGMEKVRTENYAFMMETMTARWFMNRKPCDLATIGDQFGKRSYGLAIPKNWPYEEQFNKAIMEMIQTGEIDELEQRWWENKGECWSQKHWERTIAKAHAVVLNQAKPKTVSLNQLSGQMLFMLAGVIIAFIAAAAEILYYRYKGRYESNNRPQGQTLKLENEEDGGAI